MVQTEPKKISGAIRTEAPFDLSSDTPTYFELKWESNGANKKDRIGIGFVPADYDMFKRPGATDNSMCLLSSGLKLEYPKICLPFFEEGFSVGDTVGLGIDIMGRIFFTKNGNFIGIQAELNRSTSTQIFPTAVLTAVGQIVKLNFGQEKFMFNPVQENIVGPESFRKSPVKKSPVKKKLKHYAEPKCGLYHEGNLVPLVKASVTVDIINHIAEVNIVHVYKREGGEKRVPAVFFFPMRDIAAISSFQVEAENYEYYREIIKKGEPRDIDLDQIEKHGSTLLDQSNGDVFFASLESLPRKNVTVKISYFQILTQTSLRSERLSFVLPTEIVPRYTRAPPDQETLSQAVTVEDEEISSPVQLEIGISICHTMLQDINSETHTLERVKTRGKVDSIITAFVNIKNFDIDFVLDVDLINKRADIKPRAVVEFLNEASVACLMEFFPSFPHRKDQSARSDEYVFVLDQVGNSFEDHHVTSALELAIRTIPDSCKFQIVSQRNSQEPFLFAKPQPLTDDTLKQAQKYIKNFKLEGEGSLFTALSMIFEEMKNTHKTNIFILTDVPSKENQDVLALVQEKSMYSRSQIFPLGIGSQVEPTFVKQLASFGKGRGELVFSGKYEDALMRQMRNAADSTVSTVDVDFSILEAENTLVKIPRKFPVVSSGNRIRISAILERPFYKMFERFEKDKMSAEEISRKTHDLMEDLTKNKEMTIDLKFEDFQMHLPMERILEGDLLHRIIAWEASREVSQEFDSEEERTKLEWLGMTYSIENSEAEMIAYERPKGKKKYLRDLGIVSGRKENKEAQVPMTRGHSVAFKNFEEIDVGPSQNIMEDEEDQVENQVENQVESQVESQVENQVEDQVEKNGNDKMEVEREENRDESEDDLFEKDQNQLEKRVENQVEKNVAEDMMEDSENIFSQDIILPSQGPGFDLSSQQMEEYSQPSDDEDQVLISTQEPVSEVQVENQVENQVEKRVEKQVEKPAVPKINIVPPVNKKNSEKKSNGSDLDDVLSQSQQISEKPNEELHLRFSSIISEQKVDGHWDKISPKLTKILQINPESLSSYNIPGAIFGNDSVKNVKLFYTSLMTRYCEKYFSRVTTEYALSKAKKWLASNLKENGGQSTMACLDLANSFLNLEPALK
eukprot:TRINITY_DN4677_c0_g1_i2.p1 TRINITY_DN4677_c0_g1~~TRINITY_DN4677_c0_g1_i2.p1  ORF type:complete len:1309 (+),score=563.76 TRINITY_DN4677_c0_g1_i2:520-3927(+)